MSLPWQSVLGHQCTQHPEGTETLAHPHHAVPHRTGRAGDRLHALLTSVGWGGGGVLLTWAPPTGGASPGAHLGLGIRARAGPAWFYGCWAIKKEITRKVNKLTFTVILRTRLSKKLCRGLNIWIVTNENEFVLLDLKGNSRDSKTFLFSPEINPNFCGCRSHTRLRRNPSPPAPVAAYRPGQTQ